MGRAGKLSVAELLLVLGQAAARGGCLTDEQLEALQAARLRSLSDALAGSYLTDPQRTKMIDLVLSRLDHRSQVDATEAIADAGIEP